MSRACEQCGAVLARKEKERPYSFAQRRFCGRECVGASRAGSIDVLGISMTRQELADVLGVTKGVIGSRIHRGQCPITGKETK